MEYSKFIRFNIIGGTLWVLGLTLLGYFFGNLEFVQKNFELVIFGIIGLSLLPMIIEIIRQKIKK
jgi:membrane-associated protein